MNRKERAYRRAVWAIVAALVAAGAFPVRPAAARPITYTLSGGWGGTATVDVPALAAEVNQSVGLTSLAISGIGASGDPSFVWRLPSADILGGAAMVYGPDPTHDYALSLSLQYPAVILNLATPDRIGARPAATTGTTDLISGSFNSGYQFFDRPGSVTCATGCVDPTPSVLAPPVGRAKSLLDEGGRALRSGLEAGALTSAAEAAVTALWTGGFSVPGILGWQVLGLGIGVTVDLANSDPFDPQYGTLAPIPTFTLPPITPKGLLTPEAAALGTTAVNDQAAAYGDLRTVDTSLNRYFSAVEVSDPLSAQLQSDYIASLLSRLSGDSAAAAQATDLFIASLETAGIADIPIDAASILTFQNQISSSGFPADELALFGLLGFSADDLEAAQMKVLGIDPSSSATTLLTALSDDATGLRALSEAAAGVPEPPAFAIILSGIITWAIPVWGRRKWFGAHLDAKQ